MASLTIIPYIPTPANSYRSNNRCRAKDEFKHINDHDREPRIKPGTLPIDVPQPQATAVAENASGLATHEKDGNSVNDDDHFSLKRRVSHVSACAQNQARSQQSQEKGAPISMGGSEEVNSAENSDLEIDSLFYKIFDVTGPKNDNPTTEIDIFSEPDAESKVGSAEVEDGGAGFEADDDESEMGDAEIVRHPLKYNPWVIPDSDTESESDNEGEDGLVWKKRKFVPSGGRLTRSVTRLTALSFEIGGTRVRAGDTQSENDGAASEIGQSHPRPDSSARHSDFASTSSRSTDFVKPQSVARVGGNGEWGIHGIIGKEIIGGKVYYCVDWEPTMMPLDQLSRAKRLVRKFEAKEQARLMREGNTRKKKRGRPRKQTTDDEEEGNTGVGDDGDGEEVEDEENGNGDVEMED